MSSEGSRKIDLWLAPPLDYSFKKLDTLLNFHFDKPREGRIGKLPRRSDSKKFLTKSLWLDNNRLGSIFGLMEFTEIVLEFPQLLSWIDLSFNNIKEIDDELTKFPNLVILNLHGNNIYDIDSVFKLRSLFKLKRLSLHGNPVADIPFYRISIICAMPQLQNLDFVPIVLRERRDPIPVAVTKKLQQL